MVIQLTKNTSKSTLIRVLPHHQLWVVSGLSDRQLGYARRAGYERRPNGDSHSSHNKF
jgi:hypothetical protein